MHESFFSTVSFGVRVPSHTIESNDDIRARKIIKNSTMKVEGRFQTGLLWRNDNIIMPNNYLMAKRRLICLENKMKKDPRLAEVLQSQIKEYIEKEYVKRLTTEEISDISPRVWYLPIFLITNPNKPAKVRLVTNLLMPLPEILYRFRKQKRDHW